MSGELHAEALELKRALWHCIGCWMGPRGDLNVLENRKNLLSYQESNESTVY